MKSPVQLPRKRFFLVLLGIIGAASTIFRFNSIKTAEKVALRRADGVPNYPSTSPDPDTKLKRPAIVTMKRPIMHTFYEPDPKGYCCGMLESGHQRLLHAWEQAWQDRGWDTRVLTREDATKHEEFDLVQEKLRVLQIGAYDQKCYWRWLAMASIDDVDDGSTGGGGWMSDYDTLPLDFGAEEGRQLAMEHHGQFTSYKDHVPCLIHASRGEWNRVIHLIMDVLPKHVDANASDMVSLQKVRYTFGDESGIVWRQLVVPTFAYKKMENGGIVVDCERCKGMKAVHLSHHGTMAAWKAGLYPDIDKKLGIINGRGEAANVFMKDYREQCIAVNNS